MSAYFRRDIAERAREIWAAQPVFLDTETTGLQNTAEIVEISILDHTGQVLFESLVRPRRSIPLDAVRLHGITDELVREAPTWLQVWPQVEAVLQDRQVGTYNAEFDLRMLQQSHRANGMPWRPLASRFFCIMKMYAEFSGAYRWPRLEEAGRQCGIPLPNSHRARADTLLARAVFQYMVNKSTDAALSGQTD
jgi:DNA polymerase-3 subunit epsilon